MSAKKATSSTKRTTGATSSASRRDVLREQQAAQARKKRTGRILAIVAGVLALAIIAVVAVVVIQDQRTKREAERLQSGQQLTPPNAVGTDAILVNPEQGKNAKYTLNLYVDYQCPVCKQAEGLYGNVWKQLADEGFIKLQIHTMTFMSQNLKNDDSVQLAVGAACADLRGKYWEFHNTAYEFQPEKETQAGYDETDIEKTIAQKAGIAGADYDQWKRCLDGNQTATFVTAVDENASKSGVTGTPTLKVNGKNPQVPGDNGNQTDWWKVLDPDVNAWKAAIEKAANS